MAIVVNLANTSIPADKPWDSYNRTNVGEPNPAVTPQYSGEIILDTTNNNLWKAVGVAANTWVALTPMS